MMKYNILQFSHSLMKLRIEINICKYSTLPITILGIFSPLNEIIIVNPGSTRILETVRMIQACTPKEG